MLREAPDCTITVGPLPVTRRPPAGHGRPRSTVVGRADV